MEELRAYFGFYFFMGLVRETEIRDYWSNDDTFHYSPVAGRISRHRYRGICTSSITGNFQPKEHRLQRMKPVVDALCSRCSAVYHPRVNISVDEAMVQFKGKPCVLMIIHVHLH